MRGEKRDSGGEKAVKERKKTHHPSDMKIQTERDRQRDQRGD